MDSFAGCKVSTQFYCLIVGGSYSRATGLGKQYSDRRDFLVDALNDSFDLRLCTTEPRELLWKGCQVYEGYPKSRSKQMKEKSALTDPLLSFV